MLRSSIKQQAAAQPKKRAKEETPAAAAVLESDGSEDDADGASEDEQQEYERRARSRYGTATYGTSLGSGAVTWLTGSWASACRLSFNVWWPRLAEEAKQTKQQLKLPTKTLDGQLVYEKIEADPPNAKVSRAIQIHRRNVVVMAVASPAPAAETIP